ncbi:MAG: hypothetical protein AAF654_15075 [Myxococcota bacterium]
MTEVSFQQARAFAEASGPYALNAAQQADVNASGVLSREERANLPADLRDSFESLREPGRGVPVVRGAAQYGAEVGTAIERAITAAIAEGRAYILPTDIPTSLQDNLRNFIARTGDAAPAPTPTPVQGVVRPHHSEVPGSITGAVLSPDRLSAWKTTMERIGSITVPQVDGSERQIPHLYTVNPTTGEPGVHLVAISNRDIVLPNGEQVNGYHLADQAVRKAMNLPDGAPVSYTGHFLHPEVPHISEASYYANQIFTTHSHVYRGEGKIFEAPGGPGQAYVKNYLVLAVAFELKGQDMAEVARNGEIHGNAWSPSTEFAEDYTADRVEIKDLKSLFHYVESRLRDPESHNYDPNRWQYCAEHVDFLENVKFNLPTNRQAWQDVYGAEQGSELYDAFCALHTAETGSAPTENFFTPLWKLEGVTDPRNCTDPKKGLIFPRESNADLVFGFVDAYFSPREQSALAAVNAVVSLEDQLVERMDLDGSSTYHDVSLPIIQALMIHEANVVGGGDPTYVAGLVQQALPAITGMIMEGTGESQAEAQARAAKILAPIGRFEGEAFLPGPEFQGILARGPMSRADSYDQFLLPATKDAFKAAESVRPGEQYLAQHNTPPGAFLRIAQNPAIATEGREDILGVHVIGHLTDVADTTQEAGQPRAAE